MSRMWNVIAALSVILVVGYTGGFAWALAVGDASLEEFRAGVLPVLTAVLGYMGGMLPSRGSVQSQ